MKRAYGEYVYSDRYLSLIHAFTPDELMEYIRDRQLSQKGHCDDVSIRDEAYGAAIRSLAENSAKDGQCLHLFFTGEEMHDWLLGCGTNLSDEQTGMVLQMAAEIAEEHRGFNDSLLSGNTTFNFMLHFLGGNTPVYLCALARITMGREPHWRLCVFQGKKKPACWFIPSVPHGDNQNDILRGAESVVSSALAYMKCFPDAVVSGIPQDLKHEAHFKGCTTASIRMHESLKIKDGPCPHYRVGHFRFLSSERFTHKRGTIVFVRGAFIKGRAKTVLCPEDCTKAEFAV